jgi:hypothetical protein
MKSYICGIIKKKTNFDRRTCKLWWNQKDLLLKTGSITAYGNLEVGQHLQDAAKELKFGKSTLKRHLKNKVT